MNGLGVRGLLKRTALALPTLAVAGCVVTGPRPAQTPERPDIVLFVADDLSRTDLGAYGSSDARTPNIDQFATEGMRFTNAFAASPSCSPSRASIYTGLYPMRHGAHANHSATRPGIETMPAYLHKLGYRVVIAGKTHFGPRKLYPFEYMPASVTQPEGRGVLWSQLNIDAVDQLLATRDKTKPLALIVNAFAPHTPWPRNGGYDPDKLSIAENQVDTPETREARTRYLTRVTQMDGEFGAIRASVARHGGAARTLLMFTADQGAQFPFGKWNLYDAGIAAPLIAGWSGRVAPGSQSNAMVSLVDILPTMQEVAKGKPEAGLDGCSFLSLLQGAQKGCHGDAIFAAHSGVPEEGPDANIAPMRTIRTERYKLIVNFRPDIPYVTPVNRGGGQDGAYWQSWVALASTDRKASYLVERYERRPPMELYDLVADPKELNNLAGKPTHAGTVATLRSRLFAWMTKQGENPHKVALPTDTKRGNYPYAQ